MTDYAFTPPKTISVPITGETQEYPVNRIFCVGRNYAAHAAEMGVKANKSGPMYFTKSASTYVPSGANIDYALATENLHHEIELVVAIGANAFQVSEVDAHSVIFGYCVGLDMTRRDLQAVARENRHPWDIAKDFEDSAVLSDIVRVRDGNHPTAGTIELAVNGETRQKADLSAMINSVAEVIAHLSTLYHLVPGDLIMTGTPSGVGAVVAGDTLTGSIDGVGEIALTINA